MRMEARHQMVEGEKEIRGLVLVADSEQESRLLDALVGSSVGEDGLIAIGEFEVRLSDGYGEHYVYLKKP